MILACNNRFMRIRESQLSPEEWEARIGEQFRAMRLAAGADQTELAERAAVSVGAVRNLERGNGSTLKTLVRVALALDRDDWLASISPAVGVSPLDLVRSAPRARSRVYRPRGERG
jgi:transcriptional regulator with XRE-family HTH domain